MAVRIFKDRHGNWAVIQFPNALITIWAALELIQIFLIRGKYPSVGIVASMVLFAWAYLEFTDGDSLFRKLLGFAVLLGIIIRILMTY